jgi:MFS superfamily sulfate permease-like transporter
MCEELETTFNSLRTSQLKYKIFKPQHSIYFANSESFKRKLYKLWSENGDRELITLDKSSTVSEMQSENSRSQLISKMPRQDTNTSLEDTNRATTNVRFDLNSNSNGSTKLKALILDFSSVNYVDTNGVKVLIEIIDDFAKSDVKLLICASQGF